MCLLSCIYCVRHSSYILKERNNFAFIDSQNVNLGIRELGWKLDFKRFRVYLQEKYGVSKAFLFLGYIPENKGLYASLRDAGFLLVFKPTVKDLSGKIKGNVDAELVLHAMHELPNYDKAVIVSGDGDFYCLVRYLAERDKLLKVLVPSRHRCSRLLRIAIPTIYHIAFMNKLQNQIGKKKHRG